MEDLTQAIELLASIARLVRAGISLIQTIKLLLDSLANPTDYKNRLAIADRLVARAVRALVSGLTTVGDQRVVIGETLASLPFEWACPANAFGLQYICLSVIESTSPFSRESRMKCELLWPSRRAIPARAFALKKYFEGIEP